MRSALFAPEVLAAGRLLVISGGQTGVDRAALDAAIRLGIPCGGWCPKGRRAEDGVIPERYPLVETSARDYRERTEANVRSADGTLVVTRGPILRDGGTAFTRDRARALGRPFFVADIADASSLLEDAIASWWVGLGGTLVNVAGPRERSDPGIGEAAEEFLVRVLKRLGSATGRVSGERKA